MKPTRTIPQPRHVTTGNLANVIREDALHCCSPGLENQTLRINRRFSAPFVDAIRAATARGEETASIEVLLLTGHQYPALVVHQSQTKSHNTGQLGEQTDGAESSQSGEVLQTTLEQTLPGWFGFERGHLVFDLVGFAAVPTSRLVYTDTPPSAGDLESLLRTILSENHAANVPTVCQLLLQPTGRGVFTVTIRVASFRSQRRPLDENEMATAISAGQPCPIDRCCPDGVTSSLRVAEDYWKPIRTGSGMALVDTDGDGVRASSEAETALVLANSTHEFAGLLQGQPATDPYDSLPVTPTLSLSATELGSLLDVAPLYGECGWPLKPSRFAPRFIREDVCTTAAGTDHEAILPSPRSTSPRIGIQSGTSFLDFIAGWFRENGQYLERIEERSRGEPHFRGYLRDRNSAVVAVNPDGDRTDPPVETAGELIMAANRAVESDTRLLVVTPGVDSARWARNVLEIPYRKRLRPDAVAPYTVPAFVYTADGAVVVSNRSDSPLTWSVHGDGRRQLHAGDRCLSSGRLDAPLSSYQYETPRIRQIDDSIVVIGTEGDQQATYSSLDACLSEYRPVRRPITPVRQLFASNVSVVSKQGSALLEPRRDQSWANGIERGFGDQWLTDAFEVFIETYTHPTSRWSSEQAEAVFERFSPWVYSHADTRFSTIEDHAEKLPTGVFGNLDRWTDSTTLENRQWWLPTEALPLEIAHGEPAFLTDQ